VTKCFSIRPVLFSLVRAYNIMSRLQLFDHVNFLANATKESALILSDTPDLTLRHQYSRFQSRSRGF
jgi:hypothetical protein